MKSRALPTAILSVWSIGLVALAPGPQAAHADGFNLAEQLGSRIRSGQFDGPESDVDWGRATAVINAPLERVDETIQGFEEYHNLFPQVSTSRLVARRGSRAQVYIEGEILHGTLTLWANLAIQSVANPDGPGRVVEARMTDGNMSIFIARWVLVPVGDEPRTVVRFEILVDPDLPLPDRLVSLGNQEGARLVLAALRGRLG